MYSLACKGSVTPKIESLIVQLGSVAAEQAKITA